MRVFGGGIGGKRMCGDDWVLAWLLVVLNAWLLKMLITFHALRISPTAVTVMVKNRTKNSQASKGDCYQKLC